MVTIKIRREHASAICIEKVFRKHSSKRSVPPDLVSGCRYVHTTGNLFLGDEGWQNLHFTRSRTPFRIFFPELIIRLPGDPVKNHYRTRQSIGSALIMLFLLVIQRLHSCCSVAAGRLDEDLPAVRIACCLLLALYCIELFLTNRRIQTATTNENMPQPVLSVVLPLLPAPATTSLQL